MTDAPLTNELISFLYQVADDELVMGHRDSEWLGLAPEIEEDVAFSSIAQDEVGHAAYFYGLLEQLGAGAADSLAFDRSVDDRQNARWVELPNGDWAFTIIRHYFYDLFDNIRLTAMAASTYEPIAHGAAKIRREEHYHLRHLQTWFERLFTAGGEATARMTAGLAQLWPETASLFVRLANPTRALKEAGILATDAQDWQVAWLREVQGQLARVGQAVPTHAASAIDLYFDAHTPHLGELLDTLTAVQRIDKAAIW